MEKGSEFSFLPETTEKSEPAHKQHLSKE